ncbi:hypothetical protein H6P81_015450 [Aristolochia fimbriata]|uniref:Uncharacterized protein n=1 Tax=Aristolochia fimbriata TaxID=158543 RepID=A0AAV7E5K0_ARIFI|nr:hypothetical protein H6P81_015450 [Aristolochia fimbriata]
MGRVVLSKCLPAFKFRGAGNLSLNYDEYARGFCCSLSDDLERLGKSLVGGGSGLSLKWAAEAMDFLKRMQIGFFELVEKMKVPMSMDGEDWLDHYMKQTVALLDFCNLLKTAISPIERYCMVVEFAARRIDEDPYNAEIEKLEAECGEFDRISGGNIDQKYLQEVKLLGSTVVPGTGIKFKKGTNPVLYVVKITVFIVSLLLVSAVVSPVSIDIDGDQPEFPQMMGPFASSLRALARSFRERIRRKPEGDSSAIDVAEHETVRRAIEDVRAQLGTEDRENVLRSVESLKTKCGDLKEGLEAFSSAVDEVFEEVIKGRKKMMGMFSDSFVKLL